jgi:hypothetical protein
LRRGQEKKRLFEVWDLHVCPHWQKESLIPAKLWEVSGLFYDAPPELAVFPLLRA